MSSIKPPFFEGKVALISGGASGIGKAIALAFAMAGVKVVIAGRRRSKGEETVAAIKRLGASAAFLQTDVKEEETVRRMVEQTLDLHQRLDFAVNSAGVLRGGGLTEYSQEQWDTIIDTNLKGVWLCMKYQIPAIVASGGGSIVNISSISSMLGKPATSLYAAGKAGVNALSRVAAVEYAKQGLRVNTICPGPVRTDMLAGVPETVLNDVAATIPLGRIGLPKDIAGAALFLCSEQAAFINGHDLVIDGGLLHR